MQRRFRHLPTLALLDVADKLKKEQGPDFEERAPARGRKTASQDLSPVLKHKPGIGRRACSGCKVYQNYGNGVETSAKISQAIVTASCGTQKK